MVHCSLRTLPAQCYDQLISLSSPPHYYSCFMPVFALCFSYPYSILFSGALFDITQSKNLYKSIIYSVLKCFETKKVELQGVEPWSKHIRRKLSTCLVLH